MTDDSKDWVHIGERDLAETSEARKVGVASPRRWFRNRTITVMLPVIGGGFSSSPKTAVSKFELAEQSRSWTKDSEARRLGEDAIDLEGQSPVFVYGLSTFHVSPYPTAQTGKYTHSIVYVSHAQGNRNGKQVDGILFLLGSRRHSTYGNANDTSASGWTPSSYEGLQYLFHLGRGGTPRNFDPTAGLSDNANAFDKLISEIVGMSQLAIKHPKPDGPVENAQFLARVHAIISRGAQREHPNIGWNLAEQLPTMPEFIIVGAPLWIYKGNRYLLPN